MGYFKYTKNETDYLKERAPKLGNLIDEIGIVKRKTQTDVFSALISSIISQQISTKAARTVESRLIDLAGSITPENIDKLRIEQIQQCGMSHRKAGYIKGTAVSAITKEIDFDNLHNLDDGEIIKELTKLKGVGIWTVEMLLIHSFERRNILSFKDLGIRRGIMRLYSLDNLNKKEFKIYKERYSPYCTVASLYLWELSK